MEISKGCGDFMVENSTRIYLTLMGFNEHVMTFMGVSGLLWLS
jgi:hypothetical protein